MQFLDMNPNAYSLNPECNTLINNQLVVLSTFTDPGPKLNADFVSEWGMKIKEKKISQRCKIFWMQDPTHVVLQFNFFRTWSSFSKISTKDTP